MWNSTVQIRQLSVLKKSETVNDKTGSVENGHSLFQRRDTGTLRKETGKEKRWRKNQLYSSVRTAGMSLQNGWVNVPPAGNGTRLWRKP